MKIKNKTTGEIVDLCEGFFGGVGCGEYIVVKPVAVLNKEYRYDSWEKFVSEWEECKEPKELKEFWYIDADGLVKETEYLTDGDKKDLVAFGNYFESGEKAEEAVEKLKALEYLKETGIDFGGWRPVLHTAMGQMIEITAYVDDVKDVENELDLLFSQKDEE